MNVTYARAATADDCAAIAALGAIVWREHYTPLIGAEQVEYMLDRFQSASSIATQVADGYIYVAMHVDGNPAGYCGVHREDGDRLFLSKLYIHKDYRGKGLARNLFAHAAALAGAGPETLVYLTVNKDNAGSVAAYTHMGFTVAREQVADIGGGYVMDDYIMERKGIPGATA